MLATPSYRESWERKPQWYEANGYSGGLITSEDGLDGSINAPAIERTARSESSANYPVAPGGLRVARHQRVPTVGSADGIEIGPVPLASRWEQVGEKDVGSLCEPPDELRSARSIGGRP